MNVPTVHQVSRLMPSLVSRYTATAWLYVIGLLLGGVQAVAFDFSFHSPLVLLVPVLSFLSLLGFLFILQRLTPKRAMGFGYAFGLGLFAWGLNWVYISMDRFGGSSTGFAVLANAAVVAYLSLYWLLAAYLITKLGKTVGQRLGLAATIIALLEWLRSVFLLGFPWLSVGYAWVDTPLAQLASLGGVWLLSFVVIGLAAMVLAPLSRLTRLLLLAAGIGLIGLAAVVLPATASSEKTANVALIQGNMPVITEYNDSRMQANIAVYQRLTDKVLNSGKPVDIVIWPESAIPYFHNEINLLKAETLETQHQHQMDFISGVPYVDMRQRRFYNAIMLQNQHANVTETQYYFKQHLLPFGEYLPFRSLFDFFNDYVSIPMADFSRGALIQPKFLAAGLSFAPSICFEAVFGDEIRQNAATADVLLNISNDAWFGQSKAQAQHLNIARMRAIENQKYLVRATNDGITAVVAPSGKVQSFLPSFEEGILYATVAANSYQTIYSRYGDMPWVLLFGLLLVCILAANYRKA